MFDAALTDVQMPLMDGYAATRLIRQQLGLTALAVIGLTANTMASDRERCLPAITNEHVGKTIKLAQFVQLQFALIAGQPALQTKRLQLTHSEPGMPTLPNTPTSTCAPRWRAWVACRSCV